MKFSYHWLSELVDGLDLAPEKLAEVITLKTAEGEGVELYGAHLADVCAARVESVEAIEGSKNVKAVVDTSRYGRKTVVCGAPNCRAGIVTAYVPPGTKLGGKEIRKAVIGGVESEGMLASGAELGINRDHEGIMELSLDPGAPLATAPDHILEIDNKSLTHRPDLWGHHGMALEVSAITRKRLKHPVNLELLPEGPPPIEVRIDDLNLCPRYSALVFENVTVQPSPLWMQFRLQAIGLNPINNIVDVTNYVMAEIAQPMHAFDADKLTGGITVRSARQDEKIAALNGETYELTPANLVIADDAGAIAIAGVIGGNDSAISEGTTRIVLESANFHAANVRKTSSALKLRTDASMRFEKSQTPLNTVRGLARAIDLLEQVSPGIRLVGGLADAAAPPAPIKTIELPLDWLRRKLGYDVPSDEVVGILKALEFGIQETSPGVLAVTVPPWRATKDISIKDDLVEEVGRMIGYGSIPPAAPLIPSVVPQRDDLREYVHGLRHRVSAAGFHEVYNYSFLSDAIAAKFELRESDVVRVLNPIASDQALLRTSLIPGVWQNIESNRRFLDDFRFFEIGRAIRKQREGLPLESNHLVLAVYHKADGAEGLFELKSTAEGIFHGLEFRPADQTLVHEHPARSADVLLAGEMVGRLFEVHPSFVEGRGSVLDLDIDALMRLDTRKAQYKPLPRFPWSSFDLSVVVPARVLAGDIVRHLNHPAVQSLEFVAIYDKPPIPAGKKSVSFRLTVGSPDRTLTSEEITEIRNSIMHALESSTGWEFRT